MVRLVRVASISFSGVGSLGDIHKIIDRNLNAMIKLLKKAAMDDPDIVCFPECAPLLGLPVKEMVKNADVVYERVFQAISPLAKKFQTYVICPMMEKKDGQVYNSAILIDRKGEYLGSYHKIYPTIEEMEAGVAPGVDPKTFELNFGKIGFAICFDLNFRDTVEGAVKNGAEIIFFPSMYPGGLQLKIWAFTYGIYMVSAITGEGSMIIDPLGKVLATSSSYSPVICKTINLDYEVFHIDYNYEKWDAIKKAYGSRVELDVSRPEAVFMMVSRIKNKTVRDIAKEFQLETREEYFNRASRIRKKILLEKRHHSK